MARDKITFGNREDKEKIPRGILYKESAREQCLRQEQNAIRQEMELPLAIEEIRRKFQGEFYIKKVLENSACGRSKMPKGRR